MNNRASASVLKQKYDSDFLANMNGKQAIAARFLGCSMILNKLRHQASVGGEK